MNRILISFSYIFHPLFIPFYILSVHSIYNLSSSTTTQLLTGILQLTTYTVLIPLAIFYLLIRNKVIDNSMISDVSQRKLPLLLQILMYVLILFFVIDPAKTPELARYFTAISLSTAVAWAQVFRKKKISLHMLSMVATTVWFICNYSTQPIVTSSIISAGLTVLCALVARSRIVMKAHTLEELFLGSLVGAIPQLIIFLI